jgi:DNA polymerase-1
VVVVTENNIKDVFLELFKTREYGLDTETTGLLEKHELFSVIIATADDVYYFNFRDYMDKNIPVLDRVRHLSTLSTVFLHEDSTFYISNAKFDMRMFEKEYMRIAGTVWCTSALGRVLKNNYISKRDYSLDSLAREYLGQSKDDAVKTYVQQNKLWDEEVWYGKTLQHHRYQDVPYEIMLKYACTDATLHLKVGQFQKREFERIEKNKNEPKIMQLVQNELDLTKTLFKCERVGIKVDRQKIKDAMRSDHLRINAEKQIFLTLTGSDYYDGPIRLTEAFNKLGLPIAKTESGNNSFAAEALEKIKHPAVDIIQNVRWLEKRINTYYPNLLYYSGIDGIIHPDIVQGGAATGRMSCVNPNLTNIPARDEEGELPMRSHFVPRFENSALVSLDYKQQEFRLMLDLAGEKKLIALINDGMDPHAATADQVGITRDEAKTVNFALLYGQGLDELASNLGVTRDKASDIKQHYFSKLPNTKKWIKNIMDRGAMSLCAINWFGRRCYIDDRKWAYRLPNALIQGGSADMIKIAMNKIRSLENTRRIKSPGLLFSVHDELVLELLPEEFEFSREVKDVMETSYPAKNGMKFEVDVNHSYISWADRDMIEGEPCEKRKQHSQSSQPMLIGSI